ncbi:MBL fold metallo-hydrolase [Umezawaea tangerina]|uniref:L-ascorbate metabolism protein UlaG (Beta-lactamase superfamily) n=1 Tax=Umezawaea tangerina TaxID=84725 RepID=A0A2T0SX98_9PSEU|nr:MBL fold metallo-hydrolase [Umezawaea tangerina]PRY38051.1 L-ascorbate metabolism protein UlaG (beta-lactamase superfamily) [Umezawaea tangerina]
MELTKFGHASVALERDGRRLVVDPGGFTDASALDGAEAVLITHEHLDHFVEDRIRAALADVPGLEVWTNPAVAAALEGAGPRVHAVGHGDAFTAAGFDVKVFGEWHAVIHPDIPRIHNVGFLVDDAVFHPGDAFTTPEVPVDTLLVPVHAPWSKLAEVIDWIREVKPGRAFGMHDVLLSETGLGLVARLLGEGGPGTGAPYRRIGVDERVGLA